MAVDTRQQRNKQHKQIFRKHLHHAAKHQTTTRSMIKLLLFVFAIALQVIVANAQAPGK